jgi:hypothetical protein
MNEGLCLLICIVEMVRETVMLMVEHCNTAKELRRGRR